MTEAAEAPASSPVPTPGNFYRIRGGDTLLGVAGRAYRLAAGGARLAAARRINDAPYNRRFRDPRLTDNGLFPAGRISFNPRFACDVGAQARGPLRAPFGRCFATILIPGDAPTGRRVIENAPAAPAGTAHIILSEMSMSGHRCSEPAQPDPLVGRDDRKLVRDTNRAPFRWICKLMCVSPPDAQGTRMVGDGTGFLIDPDTIVTAAHNLDHPLFGTPDFVLVVPGLNKRAPFDTSAFTAETAPFGAFVVERRDGPARNFFVAPEWHSSQSLLHDYGLIRFGNAQRVLAGGSVDDGWNTVRRGVADVSVANVERQKRAPAQPEEIVRLLRANSGQIATTGYSGDRPCRQLGVRGGQARRFWCPGDPLCAGGIGHNVMESFLDATAGNSGAPYWIIKDRGKGRRQHILIGIHSGGSTFGALKTDSRMLVITPEVWRRLTDRTLMHAL